MSNANSPYRSAKPVFEGSIPSRCSIKLVCHFLRLLPSPADPFNRRPLRFAPKMARSRLPSSTGSAILVNLLCNST